MQMSMERPAAMILPPYDQDAARALINEKPDAPFSAYDTATRAHRRSDLKREAEAALLFCLAAERADAEYAADPSKPNNAMNHAVRAGIALNRAGDHAAAEPLLRQAIAFDWAGQGLANDSHMVEWAFYQLLLTAREDAGRFAKLFDEAVSRTAEIGRDYTAIHPHQEQLLDIAIALGNREIAGRLAGQIRSRRPGKKAVKDLLKRAEAFLAAGG
jgi:hypothetical protein